MNRKNFSSTTLFLLLICLIGGQTGWSAPWPQFFSGIDEKEEIRIGREAARQVERENRLIRNRRVADYIQDLGQRLALQSGRPDLRYRFKVIDSREANAFALPGGFIYLNRGIIQLAENESELAGVLAHELAHVSESHGVEQVEKAQKIGFGLGMLDLFLGRTRSTKESLTALGAGLFAQGVFSKYSRDAEREADRIGVETLRQTGMNPSGMVSLFHRMETLRKTQPGLVENFFSSHPSLAERQENVAELLVPADDRLQIDSRQFQQIKRNLGAS